MKVLVTGGTGFIGGALLARLVADECCSVVAGGRRISPALPTEVRQWEVGELNGDTDWREALAAVDAVVHLAARVHVMDETASDPGEAFRRVNVSGTLHLARQAAAAGVKNFVFLSSIKVNGESTQPGQPYQADDPVAPQDAYGSSKSEAESGLRGIAASSGMGFVIIRPALVYGPGVKGNFLRLLKAIDRGVPFPLGAVRNRRSFCALDNLVDVMVTCLRHPGARNQTFLAADGGSVSTAELLHLLGRALGRPARVFTVPPVMLGLASRILGKGDWMQRLTQSLEVDITKAREVLAWIPPVTFDEGLRRMAVDYRSTGGKT